ncbi:UNVERIFIED_CONTAM: hypothetical protein PYX00_002144 [Menopon gallinae]|uniref:alpha-glucosidase n=1 Tax=Menopon gallinae TaxID=328185 RepID=A0AAW2IFG5_9NEOP
MTANAFAVCFAIVAGVVFAGESLQYWEDDWWKTVSIYHLYVRSFRDSDNSGSGDLRGVTEKIQYLKETGFGAICLSPICVSPDEDFGYDISDFLAVSPEVGTMEDFEELLRVAHGNGIRVIMDFIPNHSSDKHEWFAKSVDRVPGYEDFYVWKDPAGFDVDGRPIPPNNWLSVFYGSGWTYNEKRKQFYLHQFGVFQPDLNFRNPKVVDAMNNVLRFWLRKGVDGFRIDAIPYLYEDSHFRNENLTYEPGNDPNVFEYLNHSLTMNLPETYEMVEQWRALVEEESRKDNVQRILIVEAFATIEETVRYFGTKERPGAHFPYNYNIMQKVDMKLAAQDFKRRIDSWFNHMPHFGVANWVTGVHDQHRIGNKLGPDIIDGMNMISLLLPGVSVTYYGEEIGMLDNEDITYEETIDPQGRNFPKSKFKERARDFERTPFQWDDSVNAGFNNGSKPWLPVNKNYRTLNLEAQKLQPYSHYTFFTDLMRLRRSNAVRKGTMMIRLLGQGSLGFIRGSGSEDFVIAILNFSNVTDTIDVSYEFLVRKERLYVFATDPNSGYAKGSRIRRGVVNLQGRSCIVLTSKDRDRYR